jgi:hypothetical protein
MQPSSLPSSVPSSSPTSRPTVHCYIGGYVVQNECFECPTGQISESIHATSCISCAAGYYANEGAACIPCPINTFTDQPDSIQCKSCSHGRTTPSIGTNTGIHYHFKYN